MKTLVTSTAVAALGIAMLVVGSPSASAAKLKSETRKPQPKITVYYPNGVIKKVCTGAGQKHCAGN